jgi:hypothetical protein
MNTLPTSPGLLTLGSAFGHFGGQALQRIDPAMEESYPRDPWILRTVDSAVDEPHREPEENGFKANLEAGVPRSPASLGGERESDRHDQQNGGKLDGDMSPPRFHEPFDELPDQIEFAFG